MNYKTEKMKTIIWTFHATKKITPQTTGTSGHREDL